MPLRVVEDPNSGDIVIASNTVSHSNAIIELRGTNARKLALEAATKRGYSRPSCGLLGAPYPVDADGNMIEDPKSGIKAAEYRINIPVTSALN